MTVPLNALPHLCSATQAAASGSLLQHKHSCMTNGDDRQEDSDTAEETPWTLANVSAQRAMRGSTRRDAELAQSGNPKRYTGRPARLADGAVVLSDDELGVPLLTGAAVSEPPPTAAAKRAKLQNEAFPSTDAGDAHAGPSEEPAAQREGAAGERAPRRSARHRTPSRRLADAVADAAGHQHDALFASKRTADGQLPRAGEGRPQQAPHSTATSLHPRGEYPSNLLPVHDISSDSAGPHLNPSMHGKRPRITPVKFVNTTFVPITGMQATPSHVALHLAQCAAPADAKVSARLQPLRHRRRDSLLPHRRSPQPRAASLPSASLSPPQHAELTLGNPNFHAQMDGVPFAVGEISFQGD